MTEGLRAADGMTSAHPGREDDHVEPQLDYPASKLAAERELRVSSLNWSTMSMVHHRGTATVMRLALTGAMDRRLGFRPTVRSVHEPLQQKLL